MIGVCGGSGRPANDDVARVRPLRCRGTTHAGDGGWVVTRMGEDVEWERMRMRVRVMMQW